MPYDAALDKCLYSKSWENEAEKLVVSVYSYNNGPKKMQILRNIKDNNGDFRFAKLGRVNKEEAEAILPLMQEALNLMD